MSIVVFAPRSVVGGGLYFDLSLLEWAAEVILLIILSGVGSVVTRHTSLRAIIYFQIVVQTLTRLSE